ncbi:ATP-binding protein [Patescibacteria group bacterium]
MAYFREIYPKLISEKDNNKIIILLGARQVGKTTILKELQKEIQKEATTFYLDLDFLANYEIISSTDNLIAYLKQNDFHKGERYYLFLDEIQRFKDISMILKNLYDHYPEIKIYATGSSSLDIKKNLKDSLAGRKIIFHIHPLSFYEFLIFKNQGDLAKLLLTEKNILIETYLPYLYEFLVFGGYPEVALTNDNARKVSLLESIFDLYFKKDIIELMQIDDIDRIKNCLRIVAADQGQLINYSHIAREIGSSVRDVKKYLEIFKDTFILFQLNPFFSNKHKEIIKTPKYYFWDNGIRNYFLKNFQDINSRADAGFLFESFVIGGINKRKNVLQNLKFWRSKLGQEIDLVIEDQNNISPYEIKFKTSQNRKDYSGLVAFMDKYKIDKGFLISLANLQEKNIDGKKIIYQHPFNLTNNFY